MVTPEEFEMLIEQRFIGSRLYSSFTRSYSPLPKRLDENSWMRYARHRRDRWGCPYSYDATAEAIYKRRDGNFASLLASYTAQLEYAGKTLFAIEVGTYNEGDYFWHGANSENSAFTIRSLGDYNAAWEHFFPKYDGYDEYDWNWTHCINFVVAPTSIIEVSQP